MGRSRIDYNKINRKEGEKMSVCNFEDLKAHIGHRIVCVSYEKDKYIYNVAVECETCNEVLVDFDNYKSEKKK